MRQPLRRLTLAQRLWRKRPPPLVAAPLALALVFALGGLWLSRIPAPLAGPPVVIAAIPETAELVTSSTDLAEDGSAEDLGQTPEEVIDQNAVEIEGGELGEAETAAAPDGSQEAMLIVAPHRPLKKAPVEAVTEKTGQGPLPRISDQGRKPFDVYSQITPLGITTSDRPRIALVLGGMGLNAKLTRKAISLLPGDVTLGFAPYGEDLQAQVNAARAGGHEVLLQVPMEPPGYPGANPGPNTLLSDAKPQQNIDALKWHMSRFAGYSGITNYMGGRLLASALALTPVMKELKARGLVFLADASVDAGLSAQVAADVRLPMQGASLVIDADPSPPAIAAALKRLEQQARKNGSVIATGAGLDVTIDTVAEWSKTLQEKGILLVPVSVAYKGRAS